MKKNVLLLGISFTASIFLYAQENSNIFTKQIGDMKVILLSEGQQQGSTRILIDPSPEIVEKYAPTGNFPNATNAFLLQDGNEYVLIDTGIGKELMNNLNMLDIKPEEIKTIFLTHMHNDHIGALLKDDNIAFPNAKLFLSQKERDYWIEKENTLAKKVIEVYGDQINIFEPLTLSDVEIGTNFMIPIRAYGHTPGHTAFLVHSNNENLLIWGDLTHAMAVQMPHPEIAVTYDVNPEDAIEARLQMLDFVSKNNIPIAGMHIAYPGMGTIKAGSDEGYEFQPF